MKTAFAAVLLALALPARAGNVAASLVSSLDAAPPGRSFDAGLRLKMKPGWHVYWLNPGDSGLAPKLLWRLARRAGPRARSSGPRRYAWRRRR